MATSYHARCLRPPPFHALVQSMLIHSQKPLGAFDRRPRSCLGLREAGQEEKSCPPTPVVGHKSECMDSY
jgi:hypothetical protein